MKFRALRADEIECRVATVKSNGCSLLLYKDSRADMNLLDETVGPMNWQRTHERDNANCIVSIWDEGKRMWISKEDTGTESYTEKEKGLASDSFKRACFNWGIGRELYTAPFIWVDSENVNIKEGNNKKLTTYDKFEVEEINYTDGKITGLTILNTTLKRCVFKLGEKTENIDKKPDGKLTEADMEEKKQEIANQKIDSSKIAVINKELDRTGLKKNVVLDRYKIEKLEDITEGMFISIMNVFKITKSREKK